MGELAVFGSFLSLTHPATLVRHCCRRVWSAVDAPLALPCSLPVGSMCTGYPNLCPSPSCREPLNPASNSTLPAINAVLAELAGVSLDETLHLGGDEVNPNCWTQSPQIQAWMVAHGMNSTDQVAHFGSNWGCASDVVLPQTLVWCNCLLFANFRFTSTSLLRQMPWRWPWASLLSAGRR
jgi:hypothetical protein